MLLPFFFCFQLFSRPVFPASLATSSMTSFCRLRSIHHSPIVGQSGRFLDEVIKKSDIEEISINFGSDIKYSIPTGIGLYLFLLACEKRC